MTVLGIDTSNYATSLALDDTETRAVTAHAKRFLPVPKGQRGLRQSDALFHHTAALPQMLAELNSRAPLDKLGAVAVSVRPRPVEGSYMPCFLAGCSAAAAAALAAGAPLVQTSHQQGHVAAALYACGRPELFGRDALVFHISGGTTELLLCRGYAISERVGTSRDLYAGQAVDRTGVRLGFDFPAGAQLSALARECPDEIRPKVSVQGADCSLSGVENQCVRLLEQGAAPAYVAKYCLSYIAYTALAMIRAAHGRYPGLPVVCAGGVMSSDIVRDIVQKATPDVLFVPGLYASDNAIGTALIGAMEVGAWPM